MGKRKHTDKQLEERLARRVRQARQRRKWTQERLAEALEVQPETVSRYESGRVPLSMAMLYRVADALDVDVESLVGTGPKGLTLAESALLERWRLLDAEGQRAITELVKVMTRWTPLTGAVRKEEVATLHERPPPPYGSRDRGSGPSR